MSRIFRLAVTGALAMTLAAPGSFGKDNKADRKSADAKVLDRNSYVCSGCFFGTSDYYYCFDTGDKLLIAYHKVPNINWKDHETNLLTRVRKQDQPWEPSGDSVKLTYDDKDVWVAGANGKEVKLRQNYQTDIFLHSQKCRAAVHKAE